MNRNMNRRNCLTSILGGAGALCLPSIALAQAEPADIAMSGGRVTSAEIVDALKRQQGPRRTRTRRLQLASEGTPEAATPEQGARTESPRLSFEQVTFAFASAQISAEAKGILKEMGSAMASPQLKGLQFLIEGHTDTVGGLEFNMRLSVRRADAVKRYLIDRFGLDAERMFIAGKGPTELRDRANPESGVNRRVVLQAFAEGNAAG